MNETMVKIRRNFLPEEFQTELKMNNISGSVVVQARQKVEESQWLIKLGDQYDFIQGIVGWVDLRSKDLENDLLYFARHKKFKGVRHVLEDEEDDRFMLRKDFLSGIDKLKKYNLTYDILVKPHHLFYVQELVRRFPEQLFVIDHMAKPLIKDKEVHSWKKRMLAIAKEKNVYCKISGMVTEADWNHWKVSDFQPYLEIILEFFGSKRVMFGSDWPVCTLVANYSEVKLIVDSYITSLTDSEKKDIMGLNAIHFYRLGRDNP